MPHLINNLQRKEYRVKSWYKVTVMENGKPHHYLTIQKSQEAAVQRALHETVCKRSDIQHVTKDQ